MSLTRHHHAPLEAFQAVDAGNTGSLSISTTRKVLQNLGLAPTALEMASFARTFGDGKSIDYKRFVEAHESQVKSQVDEKLTDSSRVDTSFNDTRTNSSSSNNNRPSFSPLRTQRSQQNIAGNIARPDGSYPRPEDAKDSVLLKFESDTASLPGIVHGNPGLLLSLPNYNPNTDKVRTMYPHKLSMSSSHQVMQTVFNEQVAADAEADKTISQHLNESRRMMSPVAHTLGSIENTGGVINFMASEPQPERKLDTSNRHASGLDDAGGIASWVTKPEELPEGYLPALPKDHNGALQRKVPSRGIEGHLLEPTGTSQSSGTAAWGEDSAGYMREWDLHRHLHEDPLYHTSEIQSAGGLSGLAGAERTWLEETRTAPGRNVMENPHRDSGGGEETEIVSGKRMVEGRRRSVPDLITKPFKEPEEEKNDTSDNFLDVEALDAGNGGDVDKMALSVARAHRGLFKKHFQTSGPITDSITGAHIDKPVAAFGAWSPHAVSMATHVLRPDLHRLAIVRKHLRSMLPSKASSAAAVIRSRLGGRDGDKDGKVTDYELLSALSSMMPEVQAEEVGLLIRHIRSRAMRKNASATSTADPTEAQEVSAMAITTAGFGEGISISDIAEWVTLQPGGSDQVTANGKVNDSLDSAAVSKLLCDPDVDNQAPPFSGRINKTLDSARVSNLLNDPVVTTNNNSDNTGSTPSSQTFYADISRFAEEAALGKYKPVLKPMDSSATHRTVFGDNASTFIDARAEAIREEEERLRQLEDDAESIAASYVTALSSSGRKKNPGSVSYAHFHEAKRAAASPYAKGSTKAPAAGLLSGGPKDEEEKGKARADQERAANLAKFESFRVSWEEKHGAAGRKEMALDAQIVPEGPTWTRAAPQAFRVLKLATAAPAPLTSPIKTNNTRE